MFRLSLAGARPQRRVVKAAWILGVHASLLGACEQTRVTPAVEIESIEVPSGKVTLGFATGTLRGELELDAFRIGRFPVTRSEYSACSEAGACREAACVIDEVTSVAGGEGHALPIDCVGPEDAQRFCNWVSGRLPTIAEWLKAARGEQPRRFSWGDALPTCEQHPWAGASLAARSGVAEAMFGDGAPHCELRPNSLAVGQHASAATPSGIQDVLLTVGEMVTGMAESPHGACTGENNRACFIYGFEGGAIDAASDAAPQGDAITGLGFRCAWEQ